MNITELAKQYQVIPKTIDILNQIKDITDKNIEITITDSLRVDGLTKIARSTMDRHYIYINRQQLKHINYLLVHECGHIKRVFEVEPEERKTLKSDIFTIMLVKSQLMQESEHIPEQYRQQIIEYLINGLISQLLNASVDAKIEQWIYSIKELRNSQAKYLRDYSNKILKDITEQAKQLTPNSIYIKSNAMNYAYLKSIGKLLNTDFTKSYNSNVEIFQTGEKLYNLINQDSTDIQIIDQWAEVLSINSWYYWDDFDNIPDNYLQMNV